MDDNLSIVLKDDSPSEPDVKAEKPEKPPLWSFTSGNCPYGNQQEFGKFLISEEFWKLFIGENYDEYRDKSIGYKVIQSAKSTKKSHTGAFMVVQNIFEFENANSAVVRKYLNQHKDSTIQETIKVFNRLLTKIGYDWEQDWALTNKAQGEIAKFVFKPTGQNITYHAINTLDKFQSYSLDREEFYINCIQYDELIQVDREKQKVTDAAVEDALPIIQSCLLSRGIIPDEVPINEYFHFNALDPNAYLVRRYIKPFITEDEKILEDVGWQKYTDKDAFSGQGVYACIGTYKMKEDKLWHPRDVKKREDMKENEYEQFKLIFLGAHRDFSSDIFSKSMIHQMIKISEEELLSNDFDDYKFGIDWGEKDDISMTLLGFNKDNKGKLAEVAYLDNWMYRTDPKGKISERRKLKFTINRLRKMIDKWNISSDRAIRVHIDSGALEIELLKEIWALFEEINPLNVKIIFVKMKKQDAYGRDNRIPTFKAFVRQEMFFINSSKHRLWLNEILTLRAGNEVGTYKNVAGTNHHWDSFFAALGIYMKKVRIDYSDLHLTNEEFEGEDDLDDTV